jgi:hypothetical protein
MSSLEPSAGSSRVTISIHDGKLSLDASAPGAGGVTDLGHLERLLADASSTARMLERDLPAALLARDAAVLRHSRASQFPLSTVLPSRPATLRIAADAAEQRLSKLADARNACAVAIRFDLGGPALAAFARLAEAHVALARAIRLWEVLPGAPSATLKGMPTRSPVVAGPLMPEFMASRWPGLAMRHPDGAGLAIFPGFILTQRAPPADRMALTDLLAAVLEAGEVRLEEREALPSDATVVDHVWDRANRDGSPDRRFASNTRIPIVAYGWFQLTLATGDRRAFLVSDRSAATRFAEEFRAFQAALRGTAKPVPNDEHGRDAWPDLSLDPIVRVPKAPRAGGAHELTAALVVALSLLGLAVWASQLEARLRGASPLDAAAPAAPPTFQAADAQQQNRVEHPSVQPQSQSAPSQVTTAPSAQSEPVRTATQSPPPRRDQTVTRSGANVRTAPNGAADVVRTVSVGTRLTVFSRASGGWVQVGDTAPWGWVHSSLLGSVE